MTLLAKRNKNFLPTLATEFFDTDRFFSPSLFDIDKEFFNFNGKTLVIPEANVIENHKDYKIELAAPGLDKKDFNVKVEDGILTISAEKKEEKKEEKENYKRREFSYNSFSRSFTLPENIISDKVDAKYENGILRLSIPKKEVTAPVAAKQIHVG